jgi:hypothetical protein
LGAVLQNELKAAKKLSEWRAPSDALLKTPGLEILQDHPETGRVVYASAREDG